MDFSYDRFSHIEDFYLEDPDKVRAKPTFPETLEKVRGTWQTKPFVADKDGCILTNHQEFAALKDLKHLHVGVLQWHGSEPIDLPAARMIVAQILEVRRKQAALEAAIDVLRLADVDRKSIELDLARFNFQASYNLR